MNPPDHHIIISGLAMVGQNFARQYPHAAAHPIADDGIADFLAGRQAEAYRSRRNFIVSAFARLHNQPPPHLLIGFCRSQKQAPNAQYGKRVSGFGHQLDFQKVRLKQTGFYDRVHDDGPEPDGRFLWPCGNENHGGVCAPDCSVETFSSLVPLLGLQNINIFMRKSLYMLGGCS